MRNYTTIINIYDASTRILIDTYTLTSVSRCQQINDRRAMLYAQDMYRDARIAELANQYGDVIYKLVGDGLIDPLARYVFETLR